MENIKDLCAIVGMGCSKFGERWDAGFDDLIVEATNEAFTDAGVGSADIDAAWVAFSSSSRTGESLTRPLKLQYIPVTRVENACASGMDAMRNACYAVASGVYDIVLAVGVEKLKDSALSGLPRPGGLGYWHPLFDVGAAAPSDYALAANRYFHQYNLSPKEGKELLARIAVKNHRNGSLSPKAHFQREITLEQAVNAPIISWPLGLFDCCPTTDGAAAVIITRANMAKSFREDYILVKALALSVGPGFGRWDTDYDFVHFEETERAARTAYAQAGIKDPRKEISLASVHDCFTISELLLYEGLGFCEKGGARAEVNAGTFTAEGELPVNTDGGLKSFGHPIGASGIREIYEIYKQLQGKAGGRQLKNPVLGLAHNEGGTPGAFQCIITILSVRD